MLHEFLRRLRRLVRPAHRRALDEELRFQVETQTAVNIDRGMRPSAARERAEREFGRPRSERDDTPRPPSRATARWADAGRSDARFALRSLRRDPGFVATVIATLGLGIGANATMFGVLDRLLLRAPVHVSEPSRVMHAAIVRGGAGADRAQEVLSYPVFRDLREMNVFAATAAYHPRDLALGRGPGARKITGALVTPDYFAALGVRAALGRLFQAADARLAVVVVSFELWRRELRADPAAVGSALDIGGQRFTVIGVAPAGFAGAEREPYDVWLPLAAVMTPQSGEASWMEGRQSYWLFVVARLRDGVSRQEAEDRATAALRDADPQWREPGAAYRLRLRSVVPREALADNPSARAATLLGAVSLLVLLIACANVANLQLARAVRRRREIAVRLALGVGRGRLLAQLLVESVLLALAGGAAALLVAHWGGRLLRVTLLAGLPLPGPMLDLRVLAFTAAVALGVGLLTGLAPALQSGAVDLASALRQGARGGARRSRLRTSLLLAQSALSVILLAGTGLFVRSLSRVEALPVGIAADEILVATVQTTGAGYTPAEVDLLYRRLLEAARGAPGVTGAAVATSRPFSLSMAVPVFLPGRDSVAVTAAGGPYIAGVSPGYFRTMGTRILRGREFTDADRDGSAPVAIVGETTARLWWPGAGAVGQCLRLGADTTPCFTVVGVAEDARRMSLFEEATVQFYLPLAQTPAELAYRALFVRTVGAPARVVEPLRRRLLAAAPAVPYIEVAALGERLGAQMRPWRLGAMMFGAFGALALALAAVGLYGVLAYDVAQRTHEIGVRMALGARAGTVAAMVLRQGVRIAALGGVYGLVLALLAGPIVTPLLFRTSAHDPLVFGAVAAVLLAVATAASLIPAARATRVDPMTALRSE